MFGLLMDHPGDAMTGEELAAAVGIPNGKYGVAGVLAWPARHCAAVERPLPCRYEEPMTPDASGTYWIDQAVADLFRTVCEGGSGGQPRSPGGSRREGTPETAVRRAGQAGPSLAG